ncbi:MAG: 4Fe-4S binding protein [Vicinamibacterales bacterium]|jgi:ferredoxin-type protein NapH|nr:4Fe-4S binding protein [Vicinamibacterales bacterium]
MTERVRRYWRRRNRHWPGRGFRLQVARRTLQVGVLVLLVVIPTLSLYDNLRNQRDEVGIEARWDTSLVHQLVEDLDDPSRVTQSVRGSVWTLKVGELVISDPLAVIDFIGAARVIFDHFLITALIPVLASLLLGRVFCGWLCPADLLFELGTKIRGWTGIETDVGFARITKFAILALGLVAGVVLGTQIFAEIYPPRIIGGELYLWITFGVVSAGAWFFLALLAFEIFVSRRFWCRYICPGGALYSLLGRWRILRLTLVAQECTDCTRCNAVCEFGLDPMRGRFGQECNNCGLCVRACAPGALVYRVGLRPRDGRDVLPAAEAQVS